MTNEEAIEMFSVAVTATLCERTPDLYRTAIRALKSQIPTKVMAHQRCAKCNANVVGSGFYCWKCGQALDWSK